MQDDIYRCIHPGHGQSGQFFFHKTRFMQDFLEQTILSCLRESHGGHQSLETVEFFYPSGPLRANPDDGSWEGSSLRAWGHGDPDKDQIYGLGESMQMISRILEEDGPFIGIVGFSTGAAIAALVISLLEKNKSGFNFMSGVSTNTHSDQPET